MNPNDLPTIGIWECLVAAFTFFSPNILAIIQQPTWETWKRKLCFVLFYLATATVYLGASGKLTGTTLPVAFSLIFTYGFAAYIGIWKPVADKIEIATSPKSTSARPLQASRGNNVCLLDNSYVKGDNNG